jgi:y4mF family transcriptional regulator
MATKTHIQTPADLGKIIRRQRKADGLTLADVSGLTNVGIRFLSELENGKPTVRLDKLLHVINALGLELQLSSPAEPEQE